MPESVFFDDVPMNKFYPDTLWNKSVLGWAYDKIKKQWLVRVRDDGLSHQIRIVTKKDSVSRSKSESMKIPKEYFLSQNYPNPFNPTTAISYQIPTHSFVQLKVFDIFGREVAQLDKGRKNSGKHSLKWNTSNYPSGVYFYRFEANPIDEPFFKFVDVKKLMVIK